jgi:hypothetical protein
LLTKPHPEDGAFVGGLTKISFIAKIIMVAKKYFSGKKIL